MLAVTVTHVPLMLAHYRRWGFHFTWQERPDRWRLLADEPVLTRAFSGHHPVTAPNSHPPNLPTQHFANLPAD